MRVKLRNQERRSRDTAVRIALSHIVYRYKRMPSVTQAFYQMACVQNGLVGLRELYKKEVQYGG